MCQERGSAGNNSARSPGGGFPKGPTCGCRWYGESFSAPLSGGQPLVLTTTQPGQDGPEIRVARHLAHLATENARLRHALHQITLDAAIGLCNPRPEVMLESLRQIDVKATDALATL